MSTERPNFKKKEMAFSATPYVYLQGDMQVFTVEVSHREEIDGELLQRAMERTLKRMPYLTDTYTVDHGAVYYAENPLPMTVAHTSQIRRVGGAETNWHMLDLTWDGNKTWFSMFHGFCDGQGLNMFIESTLYHYYCMKDGTDYDPCGVRTDKGEMTEAETFEPCSKNYEVSPDFRMPEKKEQPKPYHIPEITANMEGDILEYGFRLPSEALMAFVKENGTSPAVMLSMLVAEAILRLHPDADAPIFSNIPVSVRRMLGCDETFKNCSSRLVLPVHGTPMDAMPFAQRAAALRGVLKMQMNPDLIRTIYNNIISSNYRKRMEEATDYQEELKKPAGFLGVCHDTFYLDYIGSMHKTAYSDQITDVRFLCAPALGNTLHLNMIEHEGQFRITCLCCSEIPAITDALEQVIREHGLPLERRPLQRFTLPRTNWRDGMTLD